MACWCFLGLLSLWWAVKWNAINQPKAWVEIFAEWHKRHLQESPHTQPRFGAWPVVATAVYSTGMHKFCHLASFWPKHPGPTSHSSKCLFNGENKKQWDKTPDLFAQFHPCLEAGSHSGIKVHYLTFVALQFYVMCPQGRPVGISLRAKFCM